MTESEYEAFEQRQYDGYGYARVKGLCAFLRDLVGLRVRRLRWYRRRVGGGWYRYGKEWKQVSFLPGYDDYSVRVMVEDYRGPAARMLKGTNDGD